MPTATKRKGSDVSALRSDDDALRSFDKDAHTASIIKARREQLHLSIIEAARRANVMPNTWRKAERGGLRHSQRQTLQAIGAALQWNESWSALAESGASLEAINAATQYPSAQLNGGLYIEASAPRQPRLSPPIGAYQPVVRNHHRAVMHALIGYADSLSDDEILEMIKYYNAFLTTVRVPQQVAREGRVTGADG